MKLRLYIGSLHDGFFEQDELVEGAEGMSVFETESENYTAAMHRLYFDAFHNGYSGLDSCSRIEIVES